MTEKADVLQGTQALMPLKTLGLLGPLHGYESPAGSSRSAVICLPSIKARCIRCC